MAQERTLSIIKPDATGRHVTGRIIALLEEGGLQIIAQKRLRLSREQAAQFYAIHKDKPFYKSLIKFMTSGAVVVQVLEGKNAVTRNRALMGATDPAHAAPGTIRAVFGSSVEANAVHGSDSPQTAKEEIAFFFRQDELD